MFTMQTDWTEFLYSMKSVGNVSKGQFKLKDKLCNQSALSLSLTLRPLFQNST